MPGGSPFRRRQTKSIWALRCRSPANFAEHNKTVRKLRPALALCGYIFPVAQRFIPGESNNCGKPMMSRISRTTAAEWAPTWTTTDQPIGRQTCNAYAKVPILSQTFPRPNLQIMVFSYCFIFFVPNMENFMPRTGPINRSRRTNLFFQMCITHGLQITFLECPVPSSEKRNWCHHSIEKLQSVCHMYRLITPNIFIRIYSRHHERRTQKEGYHLQILNPKN